MSSSAPLVSEGKTAMEELKKRNGGRGGVDESERDVVAVLVPADPSKPVQEFTLHQAKGKALGCFVDYCKNHFSKQTLEGSQLDTYKKQVQEHAKEHQITDEMFKNLAARTMVDMIVLHPNRADTGFVSINMYVDDKGMAKELTPNVRATAIVQACGQATQVLGDAFIGKQFDDEDAFYRLDFKAVELDASQPWMKFAKAYNESHRGQPSSADQLKQFTAQYNAPKPPTAEEKAAAHKKHMDSRNAVILKEKGNRLFMAGKTEEALEAYSESLKLVGVTELFEDMSQFSSSAIVHALLSNKSACLHKLGRFDEALENAQACARVKPQWAKAYGREAEALASLGRTEEACAALEKAISLVKPEDPGRKDLQNRLDQLKN